MHALDDALLARLSVRAQGPNPTDEGGDGPAAAMSPLLLNAVEKRLSASLPVPLRQVYGSIGNGGFGPGRGLLGLIGGAMAPGGDDVVLLYERCLAGDPRDVMWRWPGHLLPVCQWGEGVFTCVDLTSADAALVRYDPSVERGHWPAAFTDECASLGQWLARWLDGQRMFATA